MTDAYSFTRYLAAKQTIEDRALNQHVWRTLIDRLSARLAALDRPLAVLELGAGIGTMVERALQWGLFTTQRRGVRYLALDADGESVAIAQSRLQALPAWFELQLETADLFEFSARAGQHGGYDLLIANSLLDLVDVARTLPLLKPLLRPGALVYCGINFDGATIFEPAIDPELDMQIETAYHRSMDERITAGLPSGDSRTGRHLFHHLRAAGYDPLAVGSSDWVVYPLANGYAGEEGFFLHFIVDTIHKTLAGHPVLDPAGFASWIAQRHAQIERHELVYIAHQLDYLSSIVH